MTFSSLLRLPGFVAWYLWALISSSWSVLALVPRQRLDSVPIHVVQLPLASTHDWQVALLGALITLTPGTLTLGVVRRPDGERFLLVHAINVEDHDEVVDDLADMERRMLVAFPGRGES